MQLLSNMSKPSISMAIDDLSLTKCQHQAMAKAYADAEKRGAFSVCTKISPKGYLEVCTYYKQPEPSVRASVDEEHKPSQKLYNYDSGVDEKACASSLYP